jgi:competence protein ComEC
MVRFEIFINSQLPSATRFENQKINVVGKVEGEPHWDEYKNYVFYISEPIIDGVKVDGLVRIKAIVGNVSEGQIARASGKLKVGQGKAETYISFAQTEVIDRSKPINIQVKQIFIKGLGNTLPNDSAAFMSGILIGSRSALPTVFTDILIALGLSHIIAVSGYNLTILVGFLNKRLAKDWRWGGLVASLWIILGFVIISGSSASILRAGIMSAVFLIANHYGRRLNLIVCLCITAVAMIAVQPQSVLSDIGWQLSFLSLFGITLLAPRISKLLPSKPRLLNDILSVTLAAQIATAGLVIYKFDQISVLAPISNLFILPLIPSLMLLGVIAALFGLILPQFAYLYFGKFVHVIFTTIFDFLTYLSKWQVSVIQFSNFSVWSVVIYYAVICIFALLVRSKSEYSFIGVNRDKINRENNSLNKVIDKGELSVRA